MIKCTPKIVKSKYNTKRTHVHIIKRYGNNLYYFLMYRSFAEDRSLTEYGESPRKVESQNRLTSVR